MGLPLVVSYALVIAVLIIRDKWLSLWHTEKLEQGFVRSVMVIGGQRVAHMWLV
jgi:hypothetical protein